MNEAWTEAVGSSCPNCGEELPNTEAILKDLAMYQAAIRRVKLLLEKESYTIYPHKLREAILLEPELFPAQPVSRNGDADRLKEWETFRGEFQSIEYHSQGMGCGLEDRDITDRYKACAYGWERAMERVAEIMPEEQE